ncbi:GNAT family N-acetyltransferase [Devosia beringensis]|uniref:GNAT family N-acetyltransferase n=1 Tax=Devosia beringensis TaxID=2657486 RepID=UPI00186B8273|nr:GNAT family N-acetyltransferase [Devosia beringensis]
MTEAAAPALNPSTPLPADPAGAMLAAASLSQAISVSVSHSIGEVEEIWRALTVKTIESPGQSFDFIRAWVTQRDIAPSAQHYVVGRVDGVVVALLPLHRRRVYGMQVLTWFPGAHAGCHAPVADHDRLAALGPAGRRALWAAMTAALGRGDVIYLRSIPARVGGHDGLFDELGTSLAVETLYRSEYASWAECDRLQRSKSRRKHDRQQGDRLNAMGTVSFEEIGNGGETRQAIDTMFLQRSARFKAMGIRDTFVQDCLTGFYQQLAGPSSGVDVRLHILRLDGAIVAVRYNVVHGNRMFCLISSMIDDPTIQHGSPGKQCLLRVMQCVFDHGIAVFDMGSGFTDEKRHWCNVQLPLRQHYIGLTWQGMLIVAVHQTFQKTRARIKANKQLKSAFRASRLLFDRLSGGAERPVSTSDSL